MIKFLLYILAFFLTFTGVGFFRRWSLRKKLLDIPNERSSHTRPTPRGGGLIIVSVCLAIYFFYLQIFGFEIPWAYFIGALIVAGISWIDDLYSISFVWRFLCHSLAAGITIWGLGFFENFYIPFIGTIGAGGGAFVIWFVWIVWLINAYNFMDGIDGIAGVQAFAAGLGWFFVGNFWQLETIGFYGVVLSASSLGFLLLNWQPAKVFMGDVGSAFLGYTFAVLPLLAAKQTEQTNFSLFLIGILFVWFFVFDTVITLFRRLIRGEKIWRAHREHLYQKLVEKGFSHQFVAIFYGTLSSLTILLTVFWISTGGNYEFWIFACIGLLTFGLFFSRLMLSKFLTRIFLKW
ncbi:MAG TPA: glycosyltransferase family 4 protein [Pyrinomonadaceae bacterium]|nr:glycosyltransferase family 4 protein [Pyrinomonadaceae bacterium]